MEEVLRSSEKLKLEFVFNPNKCIVCNACVNACNNAYGGLNWRKLLVFESEGVKVGVSISCNHCENPLCMKVCPSDAIKKNEMGIIYIDSKECIGCGYCTWACPYEEPTFNKEGIMTKCDFCMDRLLNKKGLPLCVEACPTGALSFGWVKETEYKADYLAPYSITKPKITIRESKVKINANPLKTRREKNYWQLLVFTIASELSLGTLILKFNNFIPLMLMLIALLPAILHINRKERFYKVIRNLKSSWLSREVLFSSLSVLSLLTLLLTNLQIVYYISLALTSLAVLSSLMVYMLKSTPSWYNLNTPVSFIGTIFTTVFPLGYFVFHLTPLTLVLPLIFSLMEIVTSRRKMRIILNSVFLITLISSILLPLISILASALAVSSEVIERKEFFEKILYYGLPV